MPAATMKWKVLESVGVVVHTSENPSDAEWEAFIATSKAVRRAGLIVTDGGGPTAAQRRLIQGVAEFREVPTAIVSPSAMVRGIVTVLRWFGKNVRAFHPLELDDALRYVGAADPAAAATVLLAVAELKADLAGVSLEALTGKGVMLHDIAASRIDKLAEDREPGR